jgi:voltage-gated potassium channel
MPALSAHVHETAKARLAEAGDIASAELAQAVHDDQPVAE